MSAMSISESGRTGERGRKDTPISSHFKQDTRQRLSPRLEPRERRPIQVKQALPINQSSIVSVLWNHARKEDLASFI